MSWNTSFTSIRGRWSVIGLLALSAVLALLAGGHARAAGRPAAMPTDQIIVRFHDTADPARSTAGMTRLLDRLSEAAGVELTFVRPMSGGAYVFRLPARAGAAEAAAISRDLAGLPEVAYAEPDAILQAIGNPPARPGLSRQPNSPRSTSISPDDPSFADQWHYRYVPGEEEGVNLLPAWDLTTGSADIVVAVIDTGIRPHADLAGRTVPGYDFINDPAVANDGNGRDADPSDPGDWITKNQCFLGSPAQPSSWHGTHVAGTIGAASNNASDVAGINWNALILPVRVLGQCGGYTSDIVDGIRWAAGLAVPAAPANSHPARVINLSLGGPGTCSATYQDAFDDAAAAGTVAIVAAGNSSDIADFYRPASCDGVVTVAATNRVGDRAWYSNYGSVVEVSAPGGETDLVEADGVLSTLNDGPTVPGNDSLAYYQGTSMAAPHVAGLASLLLGESPALTPAQVSDILMTTARDFPNGSSCSTSTCGTGIVDAFAALEWLMTGLQPPNLVAPADGATLDTATPIFEWSAVNGAESYGLVVATDDVFSAGPIDTQVSETTFSPAEPLADGTYFWRVNANAAAGSEFSDWSEVRSFTIDTTPPACDTPATPSLIAPADGATIDGANPTYMWNAAAETPQFELRVDNDVDFSSPIVETMTSETSYQAAEPPAAGQYFWSVRGRNLTELCDVTGEWSEVWTFTVEEPVVTDYLLYLPAVVGE